MIQERWRYLQDVEIWRRSVRTKDLINEDIRYDTIRHGYWIKIPSKTYLTLSLKGCEFGRYLDQDPWATDKEII